MMVSLSISSLAALFTLAPVATDAFSSVPTGQGARRRIHDYSSTTSSPVFRTPVAISSTTDAQLPDAAFQTLPFNTFAGQIEEALKDRFGEENISRVLQCWRMLDADHQTVLDVQDLFSDQGNSVEGESLRKQQCNSYVPGLTLKEFWDTNEEQQFDWTRKLESKYSVIKREFQSVMAKPDLLQKKGNNVWSAALTEEAASYGEGWKTLVLMDRSVWDETNCNLFPKTAQAVRDCGVPAVEVFFASMQPNSRIQPHSDFTNFVLTSHLAVDIPYSGENKCRLRVGDTERQWINGHVSVFDTSIWHDAVNDSDLTRYILMMRVWHPDLTDVERQALQFIYDALDIPELASPYPNEREAAQKLADERKTFPTISRGNSKSVRGFGAGGFGGGANKQKKKGGGKSSQRFDTSLQAHASSNEAPSESGDSNIFKDKEMARRIMYNQQARCRESMHYQIIAAKETEALAQRMEDTYPDRFTFHPTQWDKFPDGTDQIEIGGFTPQNLLSGEHVLFLASFHNNDVTLSQFQVMICLLQSFIESLTVVLPFSPVGTMERVIREGQVATAATYAHMFSSLPSCGRPTRLMVYDLHTLQNRFYLHGNAVASLHSAIPLLKERLKSHKVNCVAFPDDGAAKRFGSFFEDMEVIVCGKTRGEGDERTVVIQDGNATNKHIVIVDDLVQTGGTLYETGKVLEAAGATSVHAFCSHAVFPNDSWKRFNKGGDRECFETFWVTNSIPTVTDQLPVKDGVFEILDLMDLIINDLDHYSSNKPLK